MGSNSFNTKNPGDVIASADPNQYKTGLTEDVVPRNSSGVPTDSAGGLGSTLYRWASSYFTRLYLGVAAEAVSVTASGTAFRVEIGGTAKMVVDTSGIDGTYAKAGTWLLSMFTSTQRPTIRSQEFTSDSTWTVPAGVTVIYVQGCSGGGGGGGGGGANAGGGAGGGSADWVGPVMLDVTASQALTIDIGGGGNGGGGANNPSASAGSPGTVSRVLDGTTVLFSTMYAPGGGATASGTASTAGGTASGYFYFGGAGGAGGAGTAAGGDGAAGSAGTARSWLRPYSGGAGGGNIGGGGGGGGGGAAGVNGAGGAGGTQGTTGAAGQAGQGNGAGGGGGGSSRDGGSGGTGVGGQGGAGGSGLIKITWVGGST